MRTWCGQVVAGKLTRMIATPNFKSYVFVITIEPLSFRVICNEKERLAAERDQEGDATTVEGDADLDAQLGELLVELVRFIGR